ncbi:MULTISPECIES: transglutaminase-like domain-containing protein [Candidatus Accumulibacter]|uniref:Transglutaminase domain protein n=1 Tax=Candidatus Accumulibacter phosphatis TaxID=327160 RepID=A0A5S4F6E8_9PROT|nr:MULTISPECIES: transglutaminase-like domain-containing protein [Candidatus Accumulibacter]MCC2866921.1 transglutaminase-like domain-containing protein [Candidatus Accumulibacter phosphatis]MCM8623034.1 transglutaminase-like domain-containing protein [Accumulibacter sp.]TMQ76323.1 transglutaminase domain protein [Candidatus Accumulibacter phosphatis]
MKRRDFLAASALLSLLAPSSVLAVNKKKAAAQDAAKPAAKSTAKPAGKTSSRETTRSSGSRASTRARHSYRPVVEKPSATPAPAPSPSPIAAVEQRNAISLPDEPQPNWRTYDITSQITINQVKGKLRLWLPLAQYKDTPWQRSLGHFWRGNFDSAGIYRDPVADMEVFYADWKEGSPTPQLQINSQVAKLDRHFDITRRGSAAERSEVLRRCLQSSNLVPIDGLVRRTAERAIGRIKDPVAQGKAIYDWVVENTSFDPAQSGIGRGDVEAMLDSGQLSGKSADIALLFVGLCRSIGIPARPVFGLRVDSSRLFSGLGATGNLRAVQHCRAEFYTPGYGWIPVDPGDVRKAIHDEHLGNGDAKLVVLRKLLFGFWEMNWIAYNAAQDVSLRGASGGGLLPFLVLPQAEAAGVRFDSTDIQRFGYTVNASRVEG